jgi:hypothetical protein
MNHPIITTLVLFLCISSISARPQSEIVGQVTDSEGAVLAKARVLLHWDPSGSTVGLMDNIGTKQDVTALTDANGNYSFTVPPGFYDVFVSAMSFTPASAKIRVKQGHRATFNTKLRVDPLVSKELGHEISAGPE